MSDNTGTDSQTAPEAAPLLEAQGLTITAGGSVLHTGLSLTLMPGELVAVTGPSGSGKTTLLRTLVGLQDAAMGSVRLQGRDAEQWGWPEFRRRVVLVTQKPILLDMSVEGNLRQPFTYRVAQGPFPTERARQMLDACGVGAERMGQDARTLSVGTAAACVADPGAAAESACSLYGRADQCARPRVDGAGAADRQRGSRRARPGRVDRDSQYASVTGVVYAADRSAHGRRSTREEQTP